jgi:hypothetical protein
VCLLVTVVLPSDADLEGLRALTRDLVLEPMDTSPMRSHLQRDERYFSTAAAMCSCGTFLGSNRRRGHRDGVTPAKLEQLRRKGWSAAKIDAWIATKSAVAASRASDRAAWRAWLDVGVREGRVRSLGVLAHWYTGAFATESFAIVREERVAVDAADDAFLTRLEDDVLYRFEKTESAL